MGYSEQQDFYREPQYDDEGRMVCCPYELSENQHQFLADAANCYADVDFGYSGRGMYGRLCPAVTVYDRTFSTSANVCEDSMGLGVVIYAKF
jgi:hypothetical protein